MRLMQTAGELSIPGLRHFLYKSKTFVQVTFPAYEGDYEQEENKLRSVPPPPPLGFTNPS